MKQKGVGADYLRRPHEYSGQTRFLRRLRTQTTTAKIAGPLQTGLKIRHAQA